MTLQTELLAEKVALESYIAHSGKGMPQNQLDRLVAINYLLNLGNNVVSNIDVSTLAIESGGNLQTINTTTADINYKLDNLSNTITDTGYKVDQSNNSLGTNVSPTSDLTALAADPYFSADLVGLMKSSALTSRQIATNTAPWQILTLVSNSDTAFTRSFTVPVGNTYHVLFGNIYLATTSDMGDRRVEIQILDEANNVIYKTASQYVQPDNSQYYYPLSSKNYEANVYINTYSIELPNSIILSQGQQFIANVIGGFAGDLLNLYVQVGVR